MKKAKYEPLKDIVILYAEDDTDISKQTKVILEDYVKEVVLAKDGKEALKILQQRDDIDVLITDILMPNMDGITLLSELREMSTSLKSKIIVTAYTETNYLIESIKLKVDGYVVKPVIISDLLETLLGSLLSHIQKEEIALKNNLIDAISIFVGGKKIEIISYIFQKADKDNVFHGSYEEIMAALDVSKPTVVKTFRQLIDSGLVEKIKNKVYKLNFQKKR